MAAARGSLGGARAWLAIASLGSIALTFAVQGVLPVLPSLQREYGISNGQAGWFTLVYFVPGVVLTIPLALVIARLPLRAAFAGALGLYALAGVVQAAAPSYDVMLALRGIQGLCFAAAMPITVSIIGAAYRGVRQVHAFAVRQTSVTVGEFILPIAGAALGALNWRAPLLAQALVLPLAVAAFLVLDGRRASVSAPGALGSLLGAIRAERRGGLVVSMGFARFLFKFVLLAYLPLLIVEGGASVFEAGLAVSASAAATGLTASQVPRLLRYLPASLAASVGALVVGVCLVALAIVHAWPEVVLVAALFGVGDGVLAVLQDTYLTRTWAPALQGRVASVSQVARNLGKLAAPLAMGIVLVVASIPTGFAIVGAVGILLAPVFALLRPLDHRFRSSGEEAWTSHAPRIPATPDL